MPTSGCRGLGIGREDDGGGVTGRGVGWIGAYRGGRLIGVGSGRQERTGSGVGVGRGWIGLGRERIGAG